ncbi:MAG: alpha/beta hydrolase, partial [Oceanicaulis sp.]|nr:alpha/beta hydrolase [Oceanicaulis sp.]
MARDAASMTSLRPVRLRTADGKLLSACFTVPDDPRAVMVVNPATGYRRDFYAPFAQAAAENGWAVLTFDYRGQGDSARCHPRRETARMLDWAVYD